VSLIRCVSLAAILSAFASSALAQTTAATAPPDPPPLRVGPVTISGYIQADALTVAGDDFEENNDTFRVRRARLALTGDLAPKIGWNFSIEVAGTPHLRDGYITLRLVDWANVRFGQFYQPFGLERLTSTTRLEVIDRTQLTERIALTRDPGVMVFNAKPFFGWLSYSFDVSNGTGQNVNDNNDAKDVTGRLVLAPPQVRGLSIGVNASSGKQPSWTRNRSGVDVTFERGNIKVAAEALREESVDGPGPDRSGYYVIGVYRIHPRQVTPHFRMIELAARYTSLDDPSGARTATPTRSLIPETTSEFQFGANYYVNRNVRFMVNAIVPTDDRDVPSSTLIGRLQVIF
jgi:phosphate-selective porin